ncbi:MAG: imidazole glycerol phosphate synthase subunit HisF [Fibrobacter sp.]|nr:imidazole glycerol phosphate synthase subunit HisF [Fibrobacter sp.]
MSAKKVVVCLDVKNGKVTKGVRFEGNVDVGDPAEMAEHYSQSGADELVFYDIMASAENRSLDLNLVRSVAQVIDKPFTVGGGIRNLEDMSEIFAAGASKVSLNSLVVQNPEMIRQGAEMFGSERIMLGLDARFVGVSEKFPSGYEVVIQGGRKAMGLDAVAWAQEAAELGAGEICLNSIDADGVRTGYEINLTDQVSQAVKIPVIASGGAGTPAHICEVFQKTAAQSALVASMVHFGDYTVEQIKASMEECGIKTLKKEK